MFKLIYHFQQKMRKSYYLLIKYFLPFFVDVHAYKEQKFGLRPPHSRFLIGLNLGDHLLLLQASLLAGLNIKERTGFKSESQSKSASETQLREKSWERVGKIMKNKMQNYNDSYIVASCMMHVYICAGWCSTVFFHSCLSFFNLFKQMNFIELVSSSFINHQDHQI